MFHLGGSSLLAGKLPLKNSNCLCDCTCTGWQGCCSRRLCRSLLEELRQNAGFLAEGLSTLLWRSFSVRVFRSSLSGYLPALLFDFESVPVVRCIIFKIDGSYYPRGIQ